jgi:hypothetical protein
MLACEMVSDDQTAPVVCGLTCETSALITISERAVATRSGKNLSLRGLISEGAAILSTHLDCLMRSLESHHFSS